MPFVRDEHSRHLGLTSQVTNAAVPLRLCLLKKTGRGNVPSALRIVENKLGAYCRFIIWEFSTQRDSVEVVEL
jgi:hypothetical protein